MDFSKTLTDGLTGALGGLGGGPFGMIAGLLSGVAPDLLGAFLPHLAGPQGASVADAVVKVVAAATGTQKPTVASVTGLSPDARSALQVQLAQIAMQAEQARLADAEQARQADLANLQASLIDTQSARTASLGLAQAHSALAYGSVVVSAFIVGAFGAATYAVLSGRLSGADAGFGSVLVGTLAAMATQVANYWLGSSSGSRGKDLSLAMSTPVLPSGKK